MRVSFSELAPGVRTVDDLLGRNHLFVAGQTDSGKSHLLKWLELRTAAVVVNFNVEDEAVSGVRVEGDPENVHALIAKGERRINYVPSEDDERARQQLAGLKDRLFLVGDTLRGEGEDKTPTWLELFLHEANVVAPKEVRSGPLHVVLKRGRKRGIRVVVADQRPAEVSHTVLTQCKYHVLFELSSYEGDYFRRHGIAVDEFRDWVEKPYHFVIVRGRKWTPFEPLPG